MDNRRENLRLTDWSIQNNNHNLHEDRSDKIHEWPEKTKRVKYLQYRLDNANNREYFYIVHPKLNGTYETSKSNKITNINKYNDALLKLEYLNSLNEPITKEELIEYFDDGTKLDLPTYINTTIDDRTKKIKFIYNYEKNNLKQTITTIIPQDALDKFINTINEKYNNLNFPKYTIKNKNYKFNENDISKEKEKDINKPELKLPKNYSLYLDKNKYYIAYSKNVMKQRINMKKILTSNYQEDYEALTHSLNDKYPNLNLEILNIL